MKGHPYKLLWIWKRNKVLRYEVSSQGCGSGHDPGYRHLGGHLTGPLDAVGCDPKHTLPLRGRGRHFSLAATIEIIFGLWLVLAYRNPHFRLARSWVLLAFGIYLAATILAGLAGVSLQRSLWSTYERMQGIVDLLHWFALTLVLVSVFRSFQDWRTLLNFVDRQR